MIFLERKKSTTIILKLCTVKMISNETCFYFGSSITLSIVSIYSIIHDWSSPTIPMICMALYPFSVYYFMKHTFQDYYNQN